MTPCTGVTAGHSLQPDAWVSVCVSSGALSALATVCAALRETMAFSRMEAIAPWPEQAGFSVPFPRTLPCELPCHTVFTCSGHSTPQGLLL